MGRSNVFFEANSLRKDVPVYNQFEYSTGYVRDASSIMGASFCLFSQLYHKLIRYSNVMCIFILSCDLKGTHAQQINLLIFIIRYSKEYIKESHGDVNLNSFYAIDKFFNFFQSDHPSYRYGRM